MDVPSPGDTCPTCGATRTPDWAGFADHVRLCPTLDDGYILRALTQRLTDAGVRVWTVGTTTYYERDATLRALGITPEQARHLRQEPQLYHSTITWDFGAGRVYTEVRTHQRRFPVAKHSRVHGRRVFGYDSYALLDLLTWSPLPEAAAYQRHCAMAGQVLRDYVQADYNARHEGA